jgi:ribose/xylose/arabinose/galactoside ABC-type transport system permease subunit
LRHILASPVQQRPAAVTALLLLTIAAVSWLHPDFASSQNLRDLLTQSAPVIIVGCGLTLIILTGEIDISVGSLLGFLAALMGVLSSPQHSGLPVPAVAVLVLCAGATVGLANGFLVVFGRVPSIIATLGMLTILRGSTDGILGGQWITDMPAPLRALGTGSAAGIPFSIWLGAIIAVACFGLLRWTRLGVRILAVGGNADASGLAGLSVARTKLFAFTLTGLLTAIAVLVTVPQQSVIEPGIGIGFELAVVTAVVVGGTSIRGGYGGIAGTVVAALLLGSVGTSLVFLDLGQSAVYWERAIQGGFILAAVLADHLAGARARRASAEIGA